MSSLNSPVITLINNELRTNSYDVAAFFGKQHYIVMRDIRQIMANCPESFSAYNFVLAETKDAQGKPRPYYSLTRDAFMLVVMGFTGHKAMQCKLAYIEAFNRMEAELAGRRLPDPEPEPSPEMPCTPAAPVPAFACPYVPKDLPPQVSTPIIDEAHCKELHGMAQEALADLDRAGFSCQAFFAKLAGHFYNSRNEMLPEWAIKLIKALDTTGIYQRDNLHHLRLKEHVNQGMRAAILLHDLHPATKTA